MQLNKGIDCYHIMHWIQEWIKLNAVDDFHSNFYINSVLYSIEFNLLQDLILCYWL